MCCRRRRWAERLSRGDPRRLPEATVQTCIVDLLRHTLDFVFYEKEWKMPPRAWVMAKAQFAVL
jgi:transposase-like protein